jgi:hypothetical protein
MMEKTVHHSVVHILGYFPFKTSPILLNNIHLLVMHMYIVSWIYLSIFDYAAANCIELKILSSS